MDFQPPENASEVARARQFRAILPSLTTAFELKEAAMKLPLNLSREIENLEKVVQSTQAADATAQRCISEYNRVLAGIGNAEDPYDFTVSGDEETEASNLSDDEYTDEACAFREVRIALHEAPRLMGLVIRRERSSPPTSSSMLKLYRAWLKIVMAKGKLKFSRRMLCLSASGSPKRLSGARKLKNSSCPWMTRRRFI